MTDINKYTPRRAGSYPVFTSVENGCMHKANNNDKNDVRQFKLDGEVFPPNAKPQRCDYLLLNDTKRSAYFIELKGAQAKKAIEQIETAVQEIREAIPNYSIYRRIVIKRGTHSIQNSDILAWKKRYGSSAKSGTVRLEEAI